MTVAAYRAFGRDPDDPGPALNALNLLGMPLWQPGGPQRLQRRGGGLDLARGHEDALELAIQFARQVKDAPAPLDAESTTCSGRRASPATREAVDARGKREQAYALLLLSPEFQRR